MTVTGDQPTPAAESTEPPAPSPHTRRRNRWVTAALAAAVIGLAAYAVLRLGVSGLLDTDGNRHTAAAIALNPYVALAGGLLAAIALLARRWRTAAVAVALSIALAAPLVPRVLADPQPTASGPTVRVLALNLFYGAADTTEVVELVRERDVDVLVLLELDAAAASALDKAGLSDVMPHRAFEPAAAAVGSGIASRHPVRELSLAGPSLLAQPSVRVRLDETDVDVVGVHPIPPVSKVDDWRQELRGLPAPPGDGPARILAGDFNATLDHAELRRVLDSGYVDAAEQTGDALRTTWPQRRTAPPVTLDHVLVDQRAAVRDFEVIGVDGSDHRAVLATLTLPG
ncbi:endonuclease/exonuclease/phosphatase family protein [Haloechinothrix halophila]|uniref:endonuclease/exonuclease/phosphatase family protein n=1 Tax=Haloechinothrix halophila TaxID=1069073 RepID=UPI0006851E35|nr:endonuclease/exonuclease/phosphatase family protein [Haloechinothrix halophila]